MIESEKKLPVYAFVSRIRGARDVHYLSEPAFAHLVMKRKDDVNFTLQEYFNGQTLVKPYLDGDCKLKDTPDDKTLEKMKAEKLKELEDIVALLFPGRVVEYAERHGPLSDGGEYVYKISFRAFVQGVFCRSMDLPAYIRKGLQLSPKDVHPFVDLSVFKHKEQMLGCIHGRKDLEPVGSRRVLRPLDRTASMGAFLVQNVEDCVELDVAFQALPASNVPASNVPASVADTSVKKRGRPAKAGGTSVGGASAGKAVSAPGGTSVEEILSGPKYNEVLNAASEFFGGKFRLQEDFKTIAVDGEKNVLRFTIDRKWCFIRRGEHVGNHQFIVIGEFGARYKCHDEGCKKIVAEKRADLAVAFQALPKVLQTLVHDTFFKTIVRTDELEVARRDCRRNIIDSHPEETEVALNPCQVLTKFVTETQAQICRFCRSKDVNIEHCWQGWQLICRSCEGRYPKDGLVPINKDQYPALVQTLNQLALTINVTNINITGDADAVLVGLDGHFNEIQPIFEDADLNELVFKSLKNNSFDLGRVVHHIGKSVLGLADKKRDDWGVWEQRKRRWEKSIRKAEFFLADVVAPYYAKVQQWFRENTSDPQLAKIREMKLDAIVTRLKDKEKSVILHDAASVFETYEDLFENRLDTNKDFLGFEGHIYDLRTGSYRPAVSNDYVSKTCGYELPEVDTEAREKIMAFIASVQQTDRDVDYLLMWLASTLDGHNYDEVWHCLKGVGRNGKSALADLMSYTLGGNPDDEKSALGYFHTIGATMLTSARPSTTSPVPDILHLRGKRFVVASEPEKGTHINGGFLKYLTGNDVLSGRYLYSNEDIRFLPQHSLAVLANDIPHITSEDDATWSRSRIVDFPFRFVPKPTRSHEKLIDMSLKTRMRTWGPQFMLILLDYYRKFRILGQLQPTQKVLEATNQLRKDNDPYLEFIESVVQGSSSDTDKVLQADLNAIFRKWFAKYHKDMVLPSSKTTSQRLREKMDTAGYKTKTIRPGSEYHNNVPKQNKDDEGRILPGPGYEMIVINRAEL